MGSTPQPGAKDRPASPSLGLRFSVDDLRRVRRGTAEWADRAGLPPERADDFVIAVSEIATNAVRYGSPATGLRAGLIRSRARGQPG
jgi:anti-sigma regulatory factor (Ser/Thr protein kinase)